MNTQALADVLTALESSELPDAFWSTEDDLCDCTYQRIVQFTNPHLAETHEMRLCCMWAVLSKDYPDFVRNIPASFDLNTRQWVTVPEEWNAEFDMPKAYWYRQLARKEGITVAEARSKYADRDDERPRGVLRPVVEPEPVFDPIESLMLIVAELTRKVEALEAR